jgi:peptidoglycan DL-endopeptidase CwlO
VRPPRVHPSSLLLLLPRRMGWFSVLRLTVSGVMAVALAVVLSGTHAYADPSISDIEAQITTQWNVAEPLVEKYDAVHEQFEQGKAHQAQLEAQIAPLRTQVNLAQVRVGAIAASAYESGAAKGLTALLQAGSPAAFVAQLTYLDQIAYGQSAGLQDVLAAKAQYDKQKAPIDTLVAQLAVQDADLAAQRAVIDQKLADLQALRTKAYGTTGGTGKYRPYPCPSQFSPTNGYKAAAFACAQAGKPYVYGAGGPNSYDCSGLTAAAWNSVGVYLPHQALAQSHSMPSVTRANIQIGDLVYYYSDVHHVAIYVGDGRVMSAPQAGDNVRMVSIDNAPVHSIGRPG